MHRVVGECTGQWSTTTQQMVQQSAHNEPQHSVHALTVFDRPLARAFSTMYRLSVCNAWLNRMSQRVGVGKGIVI